MGILKLFRGKENDVLASINGITLADQDIIKLGDNVHDFSDIHRNLEVAKKYGFEDIPVIGVHLSAIGGRLSRDLMTAMQNPEMPLLYTMQRTTFRDPIYRGEPIIWNPPGFETEENLIRCNLIIPARDPTKKPRVDMTSEFSLQRPEYQPRDPEERCYSEEVEFTPKGTEQFYECLREEPRKEMVFSQGIARIPSVLLTLAAKLNEIQKTEIGGKNLEMISHSYRELQPGKGQVDVYFVEKSGRGHRSSYVFEGVLYQNGQPVMSSRVKTLASGEFTEEALKTLKEKMKAAA